MKKIITALLVFLQLTAFAQTETETIRKANALIANKKYESAFKLLDKFDPGNSKPDIVLLKEDLVLNYYISSMMHQMFALKDLEKSEDIMDYRGKQGPFGMQMFPVDSILENLIKIHPNNCKLYKGLGDFYYEVHLKYGDRWLKDDNELRDLTQTNFQKAIDGSCADFFSHYVLGRIYLAQEKYKESIPHFLRSIELKKDDANPHYNLAYAYLSIDDRQNALKYAKNSLDLNTDKEYKNDAAKMVALIFKKNANELRDAAEDGLNNNRKEEANKKLEEANKNYRKAIEYYSEAIKINAIDPESYNNRANIYMDMNKFDSALIDYRRSIRINPGYYVALDNIGAMYARRVMYDSALYYFNESIVEKNDYKPVYNNRAIVYLNTNRFPEAIKDWQTYLIYDPENPDVLNSIGECYRKLGLNQDALKYINMAIQIQQNGFYFLNRSYTYKNLNNIDAARKDAMAAKNAGIKLDPAYAASLGIQ